MAKSFVTVLWDPVASPVMPAWFQDQCLFQQWDSIPSYFSFLLCWCYTDSKMQTMSNGNSMNRATAVQLSVPLITIYYPAPGCQSSFQWPMLSSHLKINTVPFPGLPASCRPSNISSNCFILPDPLCSPFYTRFLLGSPLVPSGFSAQVSPPCIIILYLIWAFLTISLELSISFS